MNTKNKIIAILMVSIVAMAIAVPMAMGTVSEASVNNKAPTVDAVSSNPDEDVVMGACDATTPVTIDATVSDLNGVGDIASVTVNIPGVTAGPVLMDFAANVDATTDTYTKTFDLDCCQEPKQYTATVEVKDNEPLSDSKPDTFTVKERAGIILNFDKVAYGPADPGTLDVAGVASLLDVDEPNPTVTNTGNKVKDIIVSAGDLTGAAAVPDTIAGSKMEANLDDDPDQLWQSVGALGYTFNTNLACKGSSATPFQLDIPNVKEDTYTGALTITAV